MVIKLVTIIIPTFNRSESLSLLLDTLTCELKGIEGYVNVIIGDNASTDHTSAVTNVFLMAYPGALILKHSENLGPDENFCRCIERVQTRFFWMIGDDDLPKAGVIRKIVDFLISEDPDILYLNSEWMPNITSANDGEQVMKLTIKDLSRNDFARQVNVWVTFISGMVVNLERLHELNFELSLRRFTGTNLVQLGWILPLLMSGSRFYMALERCILATSGNTGGYQLLTVFGTKFPAILDTVCGPNSTERHSIVKALAWSYMPGLLWVSRFGRSASFLEENLLSALSPLKSTLAYWVVIWPLAYFPKPLALPIWYIFRAFKKMENYIDLKLLYLTNNKKSKN